MNSSITQFTFTFLLAFIALQTLSYAQPIDSPEPSYDPSETASPEPEPANVPNTAAPPTRSTNTAAGITVEYSTVTQQLAQTITYCGDSLTPSDRDDLSGYLFQILRRFSSEGTCMTNICFALDGSQDVPEWKFGLQKRVVALIASLLSVGESGSFYSGVQYSDTTTPIEPPTTDINMFLTSLQKVTQRKREGRNIAAGLGYCGFQLFNKPTGVLLILGSGTTSAALGENRGFNPEVVAKRIRPPKGGSPIFAISTAGQTNDLLAAVGKDNPGNLLRVTECKDIGDAVEEFISMIC